MLRSLLFSFSLALLAVMTADATGATLRGMVDLTDKPRRRRGSQNYATPNSEQADPAPPPLAVVYLTGDSIDLSRFPPKAAILRQQGLQFLPPVLPIQVGATVTFPNEDNTFHNVFSYSPAKSFDLGRYKKDDSPPGRIFDQPGEVQVFCEVHDHMRATILVLETPYYVATDSTGAFELPEVPAGTYTLHAWINSRLKTETEITIEANSLTTLKVSSKPARITILETQLQN